MTLILEPSGLDVATEGEISGAAEAGAEYLDACMPGWEWDVDPERLDMQAGEGARGECGCVGVHLGLAINRDPVACYVDGLYSIGVIPAESRDLGFELPLSALEFVWRGAWDYLTACWRELIYDRRYQSMVPA